MGKLIPLLSSWPFSSSVNETVTMPRPICNHYILSHLQIFAYQGHVKLLKKYLKNVSCSTATYICDVRKEIEHFFQAFRLAICSRKDKCAVIVLHAVFLLFATCPKSAAILREIFSEINDNCRLLQYLALHSLHRTMSLLILHPKSQDILRLTIQLNSNKLEELFELSSMNGSCLCSIIVLRYCKEKLLTPPAVSKRDMPLQTFHDIIKILLEERLTGSKKSMSKKGKFNVYYRSATASRRTNAAAETDKETSMETETRKGRDSSICDNGLKNDHNKEFERCSSVRPLASFTEPLRRTGTVVVIRARGKVATFQSSSQWNRENIRNIQSSGIKKNEE